MDATANRSNKNRVARVRYQCQKLAKRLGCQIEVERMDGYSNYWVHPTADVYNIWIAHEDGTETFDEETSRKDPCDGDHICVDWDDVMDTLRVYEEDLHFHELGVPADVTETIRHDNGGLLRPWIDEQDEIDRGYILCDWLEEFGDASAGGLLRAALKAREER